MTRSPRWRGGPERDRGEGDQSKKDREERSDRVQDLVRAGRDDVLLGEHLQYIGHAVEHPQHREPEDGGAVRADPILNQGGLFPLDPGMKPRQVQDRGKNQASHH